MMIPHRIPTTDIGTGLTKVYDVTDGRTATIEQLTFTNTSSSVRTCHVYDGSGITEISKIVLGGNETFTPAEVMDRQTRIGLITAKCDEGTEVSCDGRVKEE